MISTNYTYINSPQFNPNNVNFCGNKPRKNKIIAPTNTNLQANICKDDLKVLDEIRKIGQAEGLETYIFGGAVRDILLGKKPNDIDIIVSGDALDFSKKLKAADEKTFKKIFLKPSVKRAVVYTDKSSIDVVPLKETGEVVVGKDNMRRALCQNAIHRDYSINSMFIKLGSDKTGNLKLKLIDQLHARSDLKQNKLKYVDKKFFEDNPIQALRGLRFKQKYGMKIDPETSSLMKNCIKNPKPNTNSYYLRLYKEFIKIFSRSKNIAETFKLLSKYKGFSLLIK